jgi:hypothetical protein
MLPTDEPNPNPPDPPEYAEPDSDDVEDAAKWLMNELLDCGLKKAKKMNPEWAPALNRMHEMLVELEAEMTAMPVDDWPR